MIFHEVDIFALYLTSFPVNMINKTTKFDIVTNSATEQDYR